MPKKTRKNINTIIKVSENGLTVEYPIANTDQVRIKKDGTLAWRNNNPGNVMCGGFAKRHGSIGCDDKAVFPDMKTGEKAQVALLKTETYQSQSIAGAISTYANPKDRNDTEKYIKTVAKWTGMSRDKALSSMTSQEFNSLVSAIRRYEGSRLGTEYVVPRAMSGFPVLDSKEISRLKVRRASFKAVNPIKHHSHAGALSGRTLRRVGDTVYRIENGKGKGSFTCSGKKK